MNTQTRLAACLLTACMAVVATASSASITNIRWSPSDSFDHNASIAPGQSIEVCGAVDPRLPVEWRFVANGPLSFNIHRHSGSEVIYAMKSFLTREQNGKLAPTFGADYCWMWTNESADGVNIRVDLKR